MDNYELAKSYEESLSLYDKKVKGIYYTPKIIVSYILQEVFKNHNIIKNPEPKILDLSCGCGNFLIEAYNMIYKLIKNNIDEINEAHGKNYINNISDHIINKCIYGVDIDKDAINILKKTLNKKKLYNHNEENQSTIDNISCEDALKKNYNMKFDYIIGNPPYIGHKRLDKEYKKFLLREYKDVYKDKADMYFCFYKKALDLISDEGKIGIITPRYFLESPSGKLLRDYLRSNCDIKKIIDLKNVNIFKNLGIAPLIAILEKKTNYNILAVYKIKDNTNIENMKDLKILLNSEKCEKISINQVDLRNNWIILNYEDKMLYERIVQKSKYNLEDICISFQGIITGCDKAFILKIEDERIKHIDEKFLKSWIKNRNVNQYIIEESNQKLIYTNDIREIQDYPYIEENCLKPYRGKLEDRRECIKKVRKWYELQWGREKSLFERKKIMYPYKSSNNKFAIDYNDNFSSADVYSFYIKEEYKNVFSYEYIVGILNSEIYDRYFKMIAKGMGNKIYDYYPNKVMKLKIFKDDNYSKIEALSKKIISIKKEIELIKRNTKLQGKKNTINKEINYLENESHFLQNKVNELINKSLNL
ncbi:Eco57I restriction-modification methylase domain-containing protein [Terrisporobacter petrolearius]|uniref:Eco57I restriction-modification methylase domain-containing protein n=1 Tax=Terrisporobacter petrolearius TaxID=1460447 RepID=UPI001D164F1F|nr:DNA methyltransferase [Terrisporobacter petrolearius]MCC3863257.1 Eco57I restriction-modification methylase domain-containing protein [Terrisporobacter petrolearius]